MSTEKLGIQAPSSTLKFQRNVSDLGLSPFPQGLSLLTFMNRTGNSRLMMMLDGQLVGIIALKDILKFLSHKIDLEGVQ